MGLKFFEGLCVVCFGVVLCLGFGFLEFSIFLCVCVGYGDEGGEGEKEGDDFFSGEVFFLIFFAVGGGSCVDLYVVHVLDFPF